MDADQIGDWLCKIYANKTPASDHAAARLLGFRSPSKEKAAGRILWWAAEKGRHARILLRVQGWQLRSADTKSCSPQCRPQSPRALAVSTDYRQGSGPVDSRPLQNTPVARVSLPAYKVAPRPDEQRCALIAEAPVSLPLHEFDSSETCTAGLPSDL
jgi:hypothetical protein